MSERASFIIYLVGLGITAATIFWRTLGRDETGEIIASTVFGGIAWPILLVLLAGAGIGISVEWLNARRRATLTAQAAARAETERWLKEGAA